MGQNYARKLTFNRRSSNHILDHPSNLKTRSITYNFIFCLFLDLFLFFLKDEDCAYK